MPKDKAPKTPKAPKAPKTPKFKRAAPGRADAYVHKEEESTIKGALTRVGLYRRTLASLVVTADRETTASPEACWEAWSELEKWPTWDKAITTSTKWVGEKGWGNGAKFEITYNWGFPLGKPKATETARDVMQPQSASWTKIAKGIELFGQRPLSMKYCHIWFFEPLANGGTRIIRTAVIVGIGPFIGKVMGKQRAYSSLFKVSLEALARLAERVPAKAQTETGA